MIVLALDTAAGQCAAALYETDGDRLLSRVVRPMATGQAAALPSVVEEALALAGLTHRDLGRVAATVGPGSFTGVRIAVAAARGYALALDLTAVGVSVLDALAAEAAAAAPGRPVLAIVDARRGEAYAALYAGDGSLAAGPAAYPVNRAGDLARGAVLIGSGAPLVAGPGSLVVHASAEPDIAIVAKLAARSAAPASPLYLRPPDAKAQSGYALPRRAQ